MNDIFKCDLQRYSEGQDYMVKDLASYSGCTGFDYWLGDLIS
jgi:DNA phosphorothioation-dependent restriction protein DptG